MYAQRSQRFQLRPASLGMALAINGGVIAALIFSNPELVTKIVPEPPLKIFDPIPEPTPSPEPQPRATHQSPKPQATALPTRPDDTILPPQPGPDIRTGPADTVPGPAAGSGTGTGAGTDLVAPPAFVPARYDQRFAADLQPPYPDALRDAGTEGVVKLRILVGPDGRVTRAEAVSGDRTLLKLAIRHVLARWRFEPATRGGVPEESWKTMAIRFSLTE